MIKAEIRHIVIMLSLILLTPGGNIPVYSDENTGRQETSFFIGRVYRYKADILYNGAPVNEFILCEKYGACDFEYSFFTRSAELKKNLYDSTGKQTALSGKFMDIPVDELRKENPASKCLTDMPAGGNIRIFSVEKAEDISFYDCVLPDQINWESPVNIKLRFKNPFECVLSLVLDLFSPDSHLKENIILKEKEEKNIEISYNLSKKEWARNFGTAIVLEIRTPQGKTGQVIYFSDKIASYGPEGGIINIEE